MAKSDPTDLTQLLATRKQHKQQAQPEREDAINRELPQLKSPVTQDTIQKSESSIAYSSNKSKEEPIETLAPILDSDSQKKSDDQGVAGAILTLILLTY